MKIAIFKTWNKKLIAMVLVLIMLLNMYIIAFADTTGTTSVTDINSYAPSGLENIALNKTVTSSSSNEMPNEGWCNAYLTDGVLGKSGIANGWTTSPFEGVSDPTSPAAVQIDLGTEYTLHRIVLFPRSDAGYGECFPSDFTIQISSDGVEYTDAYTSTGNQIPTEPFVIDLSNTPKAQYVKLYVSRRYNKDSAGGGNGNDGKLVQLSEIAVFGSGVPAYVKTDINSYAPSGLKNVALKKTVTSSSSYEMSNEGWCNAFLTDGILGKSGVTNGWTTSPYDGVMDPNTPASAQIDLGTEYTLSRVVLFPRSDGNYGECFPTDFKIQISLDGVEYNDAYTSTGNGIPTEPFLIDLSGDQKARYVKLYVSKRYSKDAVGGGNGNDGKLVQLSEIAVFGSLSKISAQLNKNDLLLTPSMTDTLVPTILKDDYLTVNLTWESSDNLVATVDQNGVVTAVSAGNATITLSDIANGISETCSVIVTDKINRASDNIMISVFWPPTKDYVNDEQYSYMADANITYINNVTGNDLNEKSTNLEMSRLAYKYGMQVSVADNRFGGNLLRLTDQEITKLANEYKNVPGVGGYYILDEPYNANPYARIYKALKNGDPYGYAHLNFLPIHAYESAKVYENQMNDWVKLTIQSGYKLDYLMYDRYPFGPTENTMDYTGFLSNLASVWKIGLENDVKTATYLQSIGIPGVFRRTNKNEIRYEAYMSLAYGYKQLSYFCWFTPTGRSETFTDAIITANGNKTDLYEPVKQLNSEILKIGPTLMNLDALEIYFNGNTYGQKAVPDNFFVQSQTNDDLTFSYMRDKTTGRNYLMVVNNSFTSEKDISLKFADAITSIQEVNKVDGTLSSVDLTNGIVDMHFSKGDGHLFALPENYDYQKPAVAPAIGTNLALDAQVYCPTSIGSNGWYMANLNDGIRYSNGSDSNGWKSDITNVSTETSIVLDLEKTCDFNRIDLYPVAGSVVSFGSNMPKDFSIDISSDGETWTTVKTITDLNVDRKNIPSYTFDNVTARYVRISISKMSGTNGNYAASLAEIEIYNDDGTVPAAVPPVLTEENIALHKEVYVSSTTPDDVYKKYGWAASYVTDGLYGANAATAGWTSQIGINSTETATEWVKIDFGDIFAVYKIKVAPPLGGGAFPYNYTIELSEDDINWVVVKEVTNDNTTDPAIRTFNLDKPIAARFIKMTGTKLKLSGKDGYLMQVGEIEAYGYIIFDKTELNEAIASAEAAKAENYTKATFDIIKELIIEAKAMSESITTTQAAADNIIAKIVAALAQKIIVDPGTPPNDTPSNVSKATSTDAEIKVNGVSYSAGTVATKTINGQTVTTITVNADKLKGILDAQGNRAIVVIPVASDANTAAGILTGEMLKSMEAKEAVLVLQSKLATYTLPASEIKINDLSKQFGKDVTLSDIKVEIQISEASKQTAAVIESSAKVVGFSVVVPPVDFTVTCTYGTKTIDVSTFDAYVERTVAIPDGIDPNKITTGIVVDPDGTVRHMPTKIVVINGKPFAKINSLTNSTYTVVWHPLEFKDVENHWAKEEINDLGSRLIISGVGKDLFAPDKDITRAEFAAIIVKALGLKPGVGSNPFTDVKYNNSYLNYIKTAAEYGIIKGYGNGKFGPNDKITREHAMAMIAQAMKITGIKLDFSNDEVEKLLSGFVDENESSDAAKLNIAACIKTGIMTERAGKMIAPKEDIDRAEVAVMVRRLLQKSNLI